MIRLLALLAALALPASAQEATVTLDPARTIAADTGRGLTVEIAIDRPAPWRVRLLDDPPRIAVDVKGLVPPLDVQPLEAARAISRAELHAVPEGWGRVMLTLARPLAVERSGMETSPDGALVRLRLGPTDADSFAALAQTGARRPPPRPALPEEGPLVVVIDPGHGGRDPGAEAGGIKEADLVLDFARALKETLIRSGRFEVVLTREDDTFVPLESRVAVTVEAGADVFLSIHADALETGAASGASIYILGPNAERAATRRLIERHGADGLIGGVDLTGQGDEIAGVLAEISRQDTAPRTLTLARALADSIRDGTGRLYKKPIQIGDLSVLKLPDVPSVLVELGFISSEADAGLLSDPAYRRRLAAAIRDGLLQWALEDEARTGLMRR